MNWKKILKAPPIDRGVAWKNMRESSHAYSVSQLAKQVDEMIKYHTSLGKLKYFVTWDANELSNEIHMFYDENDYNTGNVWDEFEVTHWVGPKVITTQKKYIANRAMYLMENLYRIWKKESDADVTLTKENDVMLLTIKLADDVEYDNTDEPNVDKPKKRWWKGGN